jgi:hypothetical protein
VGFVSVDVLGHGVESGNGKAASGIAAFMASIYQPGVRFAKQQMRLRSRHGLAASPRRVGDIADAGSGKSLSGLKSLG